MVLAFTCGGDEMDSINFRIVGQDEMQGFCLVVVVLFFDLDHQVGISFSETFRHGVHIAYDRIRFPGVVSEYACTVPEKSFQGISVAADDPVGPSYQFTGIFFPWEFSSSYDDCRAHACLVLAISALEVPVVVEYDSGSRKPRRKASMPIRFLPASCTSFSEMAPSAVVIHRYVFPSEMICPGRREGCASSDASLRSAPPLASLRSAPVPPLVPRVALFSFAEPWGIDSARDYYFGCC